MGATSNLQAVIPSSESRAVNLIRLRGEPDRTLTAPATHRRIWRPNCSVLTPRGQGTERKMRNLIFALATLVSVVMVAAGAAHSF